MKTIEYINNLSNFILNNKKLLADNKYRIYNIWKTDCEQKISDWCSPDDDVAIMLLDYIEDIRGIKTIL